MKPMILSRTRMKLITPILIAMGASTLPSVAQAAGYTFKNGRFEVDVSAHGYSRDAGSITLNLSYADAAKTQIQAMVQRLLSLPGLPSTDAVGGMHKGVTKNYKAGRSR